MVYFNLPDFCAGRPTYDYVHYLRQHHSYAFIPNTDIASIFGIFPSSIWNGGGICIGEIANRGYMREIFQYYNDELKLPLRLTFTNPLLEEKHCYDTYSNLICEMGHNGKNQILVNSPILESYLRKSYPNYKYCKSILATSVKPYWEDDRYFLTVMRRRMNNNWEFLDVIPQDQRFKIEFLCNDPCPDDCPRLYSHYRDFGRAQLRYEFENDLGEDHCKCSMGAVKGEFQRHYTRSLETYISREMIDRDYAPKGFNQFKLSGRQNPSSIIFNVANYMIKEEYRHDFIETCMNSYIDKTQTFLY